MKLKNVLMSAFLALTLFPIIIVSLLLYKSAFELSTESYTRNLIESIVVQEDYIVQSIHGSMVSDSRFVTRNQNLIIEANDASSLRCNELYKAFRSYLETSEDKFTVSLLLNKENKQIYALGEKDTIEAVTSRLPDISALKEQVVREFEIQPGVYSLGIITPVRGDKGLYEGCFISIYNKHYIFKIISSYYKLADTATYICREDGAVVNSRKLADEEQNAAIDHALNTLSLSGEGKIDLRVGAIPVLGFYKNIHNTPWYLVGFIDENLIYSFTNTFVLIYICIIICVLLADVVLAVYVSRKVVEPIHSLITLMDGYQNGLMENVPQIEDKKAYFEIQYLRTKFADLMKTILLVQHNFKGIYQLYQSNDMGDTNIDIDVKQQTISCNKQIFQQLMNELKLSENDCIVERFLKCFCEKDENILRIMFEKMRDEHLSVTSEAEVYTPHMNQKWFHILVVPVYENDSLSRLFIQLRDVSSFKKQEFESIEQARKDQLTGLYNRHGFTECANAILQKQDGAMQHALVFLDMDFFKLVNDNLGHSAGDEVLCQVSAVLRELGGAGAIVSRFGGDEFALFLPNTSTSAIQTLKSALSKRLIYPFATDKVTFVVSASIGVAVWSPNHPGTLDELLRWADADMYRAKRALKQGASQHPRG